MIPDVHLVEYQVARSFADDLAQQGKLAAGYTELLEHWEAAMAMQQEGVSWALPLAILYLTAMDDYCDRHGPTVALVEPEAPALPEPPQPPARRRSFAREAATARGASSPKRQRDGAYWAAWLRTRRGRMP